MCTAMSSNPPRVTSVLVTVLRHSSLALIKFRRHGTLLYRSGFPFQGQVNFSLNLVNVYSGLQGQTEPSFKCVPRILV